MLWRDAGIHRTTAVASKFAGSESGGLRYIGILQEKVHQTSCAGGRHNMPPPLQVDLWPFDLESGVRVTCDVGYLCANFSLPIDLSVRDLCPMYATDRRQTDRLRRVSSLNAPYPMDEGIISTAAVDDWTHWLNTEWAKLDQAVAIAAAIIRQWRCLLACNASRPAQCKMCLS